MMFGDLGRVDRSGTMNFDAEELRLAAAVKSRQHNLETLSPEALREKQVIMLQALWRGRRVRTGPMRRVLKMNRHRNKVVRELLSSERSYHTSLEWVVTNVKEQLVFNARNSTSPILREDAVNSIFSNIDQIKGLSEQIIAILEPIVASWDAQRTVGDAFLRVAPFLKIYNIYCNSYDTALAALAEAEAKPRFQEWWSNCRRTTSHAAISSFLIMPVQRVPRYNLLFRDIIKSTWADHPDFQNLEECKAKCEEIAGSINANIGELGTDNADMLEAYNYFEAFVSVLSPTRRFVRKDPIRLLRQDRNVDIVWLWLFNDLMILSSKMAEDSFTYENHAVLKEGRETLAIVQEVPTGLALARHGFTVAAESGSFTFTCGDEVELNDWLEDFRNELGTMDDVFTASVKGVAVRIDAKKRQYATYIIELRQGVGPNALSHNVSHRYSEFDQLRKELFRSHPNVRLPKLPPKRFFNHDSREIDNRIMALGCFLQELCLSRDLRVSPLVRDFLELGEVREEGKLALSPRQRLQKGERKDSEADVYGRMSGRQSAVQAGSTEMQRVRVEVPEGPPVEVRMNRHTRAGDVVQAMCFELQLQPSLGFALFVDCNEGRADSVIGNTDVASGNANIDLITYPPSVSGGLPGELGLEALPLEAHEFPVRTLAETRKHGSGRARLVLQRLFIFADDQYFLDREEAAASVAFLGGQCWRDVRFGSLEANLSTALQAAAGFALAKYGPYTGDKASMFVADYEVVPPKYIRKLRPPMRDVTVSTPLSGSADLRFYAVDDQPNYKGKPFMMQVWSTDPQLAPLLMEAGTEAEYERWKRALDRACTTTAPLNSAEGRAAIGKTLRNRNRIMRQEGEGEGVLNSKLKQYISGTIAAAASGWLRKKARNGTFRRNWNERWFLLLGSSLFYFKEPLDLQLSREFWHQSVKRKWEDLGEKSTQEGWAHVVESCRDARVFGGIKWRVGVAHPKLPNRSQMLLYLRERGIVLADGTDDLETPDTTGDASANVVRAAFIDIPYHNIDHTRTVCSTDSITLALAGVNLGDLHQQVVIFATPHGYDIKRLIDQYRDAAAEMARLRNRANATAAGLEPPTVASPVEVIPRLQRDPMAYRRGLEASQTASQRVAGHAYLSRPAPRLMSEEPEGYSSPTSPAPPRMVSERFAASPTSSSHAAMSPPPPLSQAYSDVSSPRTPSRRGGPSPLDLMPSPSFRRGVSEHQPPPPPGPSPREMQARRSGRTAGG